MTLRLLTLLVLILADDAGASELPRIQRVTGWSVTLIFKDYEAASRSHMRLSGYVATKAACEAIKAVTAPLMPGGRLVCDFTDELQLVPK